MTFAPFTIDTKPIFDFLQIQDFQQLFFFETVNFTYRLKNNLLPIILELDTVADIAVPNKHETH